MEIGRDNKELQDDAGNEDIMQASGLVPAIEQLAVKSKDFSSLNCPSSINDRGVDLNSKKDTEPSKLEDSDVSDLEWFAESQEICSNSGLTDNCVLVCDDGEISACNWLLANNSKVFHAMFSPDTDEAKTGRFVIKDYSKMVMMVLYQFIYFGKMRENLDLLDRIADELYSAAEKYGVENGNLKAICIFRMHQSLSLKNVCRRLNIARLYNIEILKEMAEEFVATNLLYIELSDLKQLHDCQLVCDDGEVPACSHILARELPQFANQTGLIAVENVSRVDMNEVYQFCCTGRIESENFDKLLPLAVKFGIESLEAICEVGMAETLTTENVCNRLIIAERNNRPELKLLALQFIADNDINLSELEQLNDCILVCDDGEVPACSFLLMEQSSVFRSIFDNNNLSDFSAAAAETCRVVIKGYSSMVMKELVRFVSCGRIENLEFANELRQAAMNYGVESLMIVVGKREHKVVTAGDTAATTSVDTATDTAATNSVDTAVDTAATNSVDTATDTAATNSVDTAATSASTGSTSPSAICSAKQGMTVVHDTNQ